MTPISESPVNETVWSGDEFVIFNLFSSAPVPSLKLIPVPAIILAPK